VNAPTDLGRTGERVGVERALINEVRDRLRDIYGSWVPSQLHGRSIEAWTVEQEAAEAATLTSNRRQFALSTLNEMLNQIDQRRLQARKDLLTDEHRESIRSEVLSVLFGAGRIESTLLSRHDWTDAWISGVDAQLVLKSGRVVDVGPVAESQGELEEWVRHRAALDGHTAKQFNSAKPSTSFALATGERCTAVMEVSDRLEITIRRQVYELVTLDEMVALGSMPQLAADLLVGAVKARFNIVVSGSMGSGKTTLLKALSQHISSRDRVVTIEDARELRFRSPRLPHVVSLEAREANVEGVGNITLADLCKTALRLSANRVMVGEVRGDEIDAFVLAATQGADGSWCTVHASSSAAALTRLRWYLSRAVPELTTSARTESIAEAVDLVVQVERFRDGIRRVVSIREVTGCDNEMFISNEVFEMDRAGLGVLKPLALGDHSRVRLEEAGFDTSRLGGV
jgi:pilus assembly protein CpaF